MGEHCELMAREWNISREDQDVLALGSHQKLAAAYSRGFFEELVVPFRGVNRDNVLRPDTSLEKLAALKPAFDKTSGHGTLTAGNSSPLSDGAAAVLLASEDWAKRARLADPGVPHALARRRGRFHARRRSADGADDRDAAHARRGRPHAAGFRFLRNPRSVRRAGAVHICARGNRPTTARTGSAATSRSARSIRRRSTSTARASRPAIRSRRPARASSRRWRSCSRRKAAGAGLISICTAGGMGVTAILERP